MRDTYTSEASLKVSPRRLPLYALYAANAISQTGDMLMYLAIPWFVLQTTGSVAQTGITAFFTFAATGVSALVGSTFVDWLGFRRASVISDLASMLGVALIPLFYATVGLPFWALLALVFLAGSLATPGQTARSALVPDLAELAYTPIERATAVDDGVSRLSHFLGAPLAGVLIAAIGTSNLLWVDAATFAVSALLIGSMVPARRSQPASDEMTASASHLLVEESSPEGEARRPTRVSSLLEGVRFLWHDHVLRDAILIATITNVLDNGMGGVLAPAFVKEVYNNPIILGALVSALGGAAFIGTLLFGAIGPRLPRRLTFSLGYTIGGGTRFFWVVLLAPWPVAMIASQAVCGLFIGPVNPIYSTISYERIPIVMRARALGAMSALAMLGTPLGGLLAGGLAPLIGVERCMVLFGIVYCAATLSVLVNPALREMDRKPVA